MSDKILVTQRSATMTMPLKWEFPGGKLENGENDLDCIKREIREELSIEIQVIKKLTPIIHAYPQLKIELIPFVAKYVSGKISLTEHISYKLLLPSELLELDWAEADIPIVNEFLEKYL